MTKRPPALLLAFLMLLIGSTLWPVVRPDWANASIRGQEAGDPIGECDKLVCTGGREKGPIVHPITKPQPGRSAAPRPVDAHPPQFRYIPTCPSGRPDDLCAAATASCPNGGLQVWVYVSTWTGAAYGPSTFRTNPPSICLGADAAVAAGIDPVVAITAIMQRDWKSFALPAPTVGYVPQPYAVAGAKTRFTAAQQRRTSLPPTTILGLPVTLTLTASSYTWHYGDGQSSRVAADRDRPSIEHVYRVKGPLTATCTTTYTATFTVPGRPDPIPLTGTATVPGPPTPVTVREARSELITG